MSWPAFAAEAISALEGLLRRKKRAAQGHYNDFCYSLIGGKFIFFYTVKKILLPQFKKGGTIFLDNRLVRASEQLVKSLTPGYMQGKGIFETMRVYSLRRKGALVKKIPLLKEHLDRLKQGLRVLHLDIPISDTEIMEALNQVLSLNTLKNARVRIMVWQENRLVRYAIMACSYTPLRKSQYIRGFKANIATLKLNESSPTTGIKSLQYSFFLKAYEQAKSEGSDESLLLNSQGDLVEGSRSNIFFMNKNVLCTPDVACGCLKGITRGVVLNIARDLGLKIKLVQVKPQELFGAQEAFLTNSLMEIMPLTVVDGYRIGQGRRGPVTFELQKAYKAFIEGEPKL